MKLRKNEMKVPKIFSFPRRIISNSYGGIFRFLSPSDFYHRDVEALVRYKASALFCGTTVFVELIAFSTFASDFG